MRKKASKGAKLRTKEGEVGRVEDGGVWKKNLRPSLGLDGKCEPCGYISSTVLAPKR